MFFLFGTPRSGTTLLSQCLNRHSALALPWETDFIVPMSFVLDRIKNPEIGRPILHSLITESSWSASILEHLSKETVHELVFAAPYAGGAILRALYGAIAQAQGKKFCGDKSPNDLQFLRMLVKTNTLDAEMKIIHLVRDIRAVMASLAKTGWLPDRDGYFPRLWAQSNLYLHTLYKAQPHRYHMLRYEDFVAAPEAHLQNLCAFLGVNFEPAMLDTSQSHPRFKEMTHHSKIYQPIAPPAPPALDTTTLANYKEQAQEAMEVFGYA